MDPDGDERDDNIGFTHVSSFIRYRKHDASDLKLFTDTSAKFNGWSKHIYFIRATHVTIFWF